MPSAGMAPPTCAGPTPKAGMAALAGLPAARDARLGPSARDLFTTSQSSASSGVRRLPLAHSPVT